MTFLDLIPQHVYYFTQMWDDDDYPGDGKCLSAAVYKTQEAWDEVTELRPTERFMFLGLNQEKDMIHVFGVDKEFCGWISLSPHDIFEEELP